MIIIKRLTIILLVAVLLAVTTVNVFGTDEEKIKTLSENIVSGGPPPDGIPPIENPNYISIEEADDYLVAEDAVFVAELEAGIYVYPQNIMVWHEIVNEEIKGEKLSITYCPLTGSAIGYYGDLTAGSSDFGTSGKLVNSNLIMYDRQTESYWSQILGQAISGPLAGEKLDRFQLTWTSWSDVRSKYEKANILSNQTGFSRDYTSDPYGSYRNNEESGNYYRNDNLYFNVLAADDSLNRKDVVIAGEYKGEHFAVEKDFLVSEKEFSFEIADNQLTATYEPELDTVMISNDGKELVVYDVMWFAWHAFYPEFSENLIKSTDNVLAKETEKSAEIREIEVILNNFDFVPDQITVKPGEKVRFKLNNPSSAYHTFTIYNSKTDREEAVVDIALSAGEEKEVVVQMPAKKTELYLVCLPHEGIEMTGKIIVEENNMAH